MGAVRNIAAAAVLLHMATVCAQTPYPELTIQDVTWMEGTHHYAVTNTILSPSTPELPTEIGVSADVEFVSATEVRLLPGFHAGGFNSQGQFHARIDQGLGQPADLVIISPAPDGSNPYGSIEDNVVHVHKWEKVEVGLRLPQEYQDAIDRFFDNYYSNGTANSATPWLVDDVHDLNPYADDSLRLVMILTRPDGSRAMKWGFFMREGKWLPEGTDAAQLAEDLTDTHHPYTIRFRFAPDMEGTWEYQISVKAPHTFTPAGAALPDLFHSGFMVHCSPNLPDNNGHLEVNTVNRRVLQFAGDPATGDETPFFGLGVNMGVRHGDWNPGVWGAWYKYFQRDEGEIKKSMELLHDVGGNFMRIFMHRHEFALEWVNVGVYDAYTSSYLCGNDSYSSNCQYQAWAFDQLVDHARANNIYLQVCVDPYPPVIDYEKIIWGNHAYVLGFLEPERSATTGLYDVKRFFYTPGPEPLAHGVFYYWKRKYKYLLSRWGYSVNIPIIEPFNEIDQMLTYANRTAPPKDACPPNNIVWPEDTALPGTVNAWLSDIIHYTRDPVNLDSPEASSLGEEKKLFLMSYTNAMNALEDQVPNLPPVTNYFLPFTNELVDLIDVHTSNQNRWDVRANFDSGTNFRNVFAIGTSEQKRPFHQGEYTTYAKKDLLIGNNVEEVESYKYFANYDISFHNELWASAFYGSFAAGTSWGWERIFWFQDALPLPLLDLQMNPAQQQVPRTNVINQPNVMLVNGLPVDVWNKPVLHHFRRLSELLNHPNWQAHQFFSSDFSVHRHSYNPSNPADPNTDEARRVECYWLLREPEKDLAIGWVHNMNAYWGNSWYLRAGDHNMLGCEAPSVQSIILPGFATGNNYHITYVPTRLNTTVVPIDQDDLDEGSTITLDLNTAPLTGSLGNFLDTLHSDYAFVISTIPFVKSLQQATLPGVVQGDEWDFNLYPNPTTNELVVELSDELPRTVTMHDMIGRQVAAWPQVKGRLQATGLGGMSSGAYWIRVFDGKRNRLKKLIIN